MIMKTILKNLRNKLKDQKNNGAILLSLGLTMSCTEQIPEAFRYLQQEERFAVAQKMNTKVDLLFVVDNSASMDATQEKLRNGFTSFASEYLKTTWDIRLAVITTDTYLANNAFSGYLARTIPGQAITYNELVPVWGSNFSRLLADYHDGPVTGLCSNLMPYFRNGVTDCQLRDANIKTGVDGCLGIGLDPGENTLNQCVNTTNNDTVRTGKAILTTKSDGSVSDSAWIEQLRKDFTINATTGSVGHGSERGLASLLQLIEDNEPSATSFFRTDSLRGIIFISDEDDQSMTYPETPDGSFSPNKQYACDLAGINALNGGSNGGYCCAGGGCLYGDAGTTCNSVTVDGHTYTPSVCADSSKLMSIASIKTNLDDFFRELDKLAENSTVDSYFITSIVPTTGASISSLQAIRTTNDDNAGILKTISVEYGARYIELANAVGNGSLVMDISANDYGPILEQIGNTILTKKGTFKLNRKPTSSEEMNVLIVKANGTLFNIPNTKYVIDEYTIRITDLDLVLGIADTDSILINYQPKGAF